MADGTAPLTTLPLLPKLDIPCLAFVGPRREQAQALALAHALTQLRNLLHPHANRSSTRLHPLHAQVAMVLCQMEVAHPEVMQVVGFAAHDGVAMGRGGPGRVSDVLVGAAQALAEDARRQVYSTHQFMDWAAMANAQAMFLGGALDENGCMAWQHCGKSCYLLPMEVCGQDGMDLAADTTVCAVDPNSVQLIGAGHIHMDLSWLHADIPLSACGAFWQDLLVGQWRNKHARVDITCDGVTLFVRLRSGGIKSLLGQPLRSGEGTRTLTFNEGACIRVSIKASNKTLAGNAGTMVHSQHSEANGKQPAALVHALPLFSPNGRAAGGAIENPAASVLSTLETAIQSEQRAIQERREVPYGVQVGALMLNNGYSVELPETVYDKRGTILSRLAFATLLSHTLDNTPTTDRALSFRQCVTSMIESVLRGIAQHDLMQWRTLHWCGVGARTHAGVALAREQIDTLLDRVARHDSPGASALLEECGVGQGSPPFQWPAQLPQELQDSQGAVADSLTRMTELCDGRNIVLALGRASEMAHQRRARKRL